MKIVWAWRSAFSIDIARHVGKRFVKYGQTYGYQLRESSAWFRTRIGAHSDSRLASATTCLLLSL